MSLANRLAAAEPRGAQRGCGTCKWISQLKPADRTALLSWYSEERSIGQLWEIASTDEANPYRLSLAALRACLRTHHRTRA